MDDEYDAADKAIGKNKPQDTSKLRYFKLRQNYEDEDVLEYLDCSQSHVSFWKDSSVKDDDDNDEY